MGTIEYRLSASTFHGNISSGKEEAYSIRRDESGYKWHIVAIQLEPKENVQHSAPSEKEVKMTCVASNLM
jgi:hypothetical protein